MKKRLLMLTFLGAMVVGIETMAACGLDGSGEEMSCSSDMSGEEMSEEELSREGAIEMLRSDLEGLRVSERELSEICEGLVWENYKDDPILTREPEGERQAYLEELKGVRECLRKALNLKIISQNARLAALMRGKTIEEVAAIMPIAGDHESLERKRLELASIKLRNCLTTKGKTRREIENIMGSMPAVDILRCLPREQLL